MTPALRPAFLLSRSTPEEPRSPAAGCARAVPGCSLAAPTRTASPGVWEQRTGPGQAGHL